LTRFQKFSYFALIVIADVLVVFFAAAMIYDALHGFSNDDPELGPLGTLLGLGIIFVCIIGVISLALNYPFIHEAFREKRRLKRLGLSSFYRSLWKESRRGQWKGRVREIVLAVLITYELVDVARDPSWKTDDLGEMIFAALLILTAAGLMIAGRYLRVQRERMDLVASAEKLTKALQSLRYREASGTVPVPESLLEQTAKIESAQIAEERKDAILESVTSRPTGYAIAWDHDAAEQRATLDVADRIELADLVAQLSIAGIKLEAREGTQRKTKGSRVEIDYLIDNASRSIRVIAVRHAREVSPASVEGGSYA
jgi:hypothetical protein